MTIGIDGNEANVNVKVGIGEFSHQLLENFNSSSENKIDFRVYLKNKPNQDMPEINDHWKYRIFGPGKLWTQWRLPLDLYLHKPRPDVFFSPSHYAPRFSPVPSVVSVMDMSYYHYPELFNNTDLYQLKNWTKYSVKKAKRVITISKSSKFDIIKLYGIDEKLVHVVYPGIKSNIDLEPHVYPMSELRSKYQIDKNYILFVGTLQPRKNVEKLIEAFSDLKKQAKSQKNSKIPKDLQLVIVGKKGWLYEPILEAPKRYEVEESVKFLDFIPNEDLPLLYKNALCYVLPSLYEGFGLPILEAMKNDCPVITSKVSSMPEAGGDAALYVNPDNTGDIADKILTLITNDKLRHDLIVKGRKQVSKFSWENAGKETLQILQDVAKNGR